MKKYILSLAICLITITANSQVFRKNNFMFEAYYGFPNWYTILNNGQTSGINSNNSNVVNGFGPVGVRAEFMLTDMVGLGLDVGLNKSQIVEEYNYYNSSNGNAVPGTIESRTQKIGGIITFNFHPLDKGNKFDLAIVAGLGYGKRTYKTIFSHPQYLTNNGGSGSNVFGFTNGDEYNFFRDDDNFLGAFNIPFPLAFRIGVKMQYFFTPNIGMNFSFGAVHGGILNAGVSFKI